MQTVSRLIQTFTPIHYNLSLDIDRVGRKFSGTVTIEGKSPDNSSDIKLHAKDLQISSATIDGHAAAWQYGDHDELTLQPETLRSGEHIVVLGFSGTIDESMHGMYPCKFRHDNTDKELVATQFESHHAREVFPCIDEPEAKATFDLTLTTETGVTVLSNQPVASQQEANGQLVTTFERTPRMSTYLLAWVYGEMQHKSARTKNDVEVNVWSTPAQPLDSLDFALEHAVKTIEFFEEYFDEPYPLPKSDHVALPDFSSGAMENWGLITYRETALLVDPRNTTVSGKQYVATVIAHELSHQWFGNLVTMKWWNDLWLNESFANLMEYIAVDAIHPEWNVLLDFASHESTLALRRDAIDGVQSVQVDVNHPDEITTLFDGAIVYAKGGRLMQMCRTFVGEAAFQRGLQTYFKEFAYHNTEANDLWRHLSEASNLDVGKFMNTWLSQPGYPVVSVNTDGLKQEQFFIGPHSPSTRLWPIPLQPESTEDVPALLDVAELAMPISDSERLNVGNTGHFITHYPHDHLMNILESDLDELSRLQLLNEQILLVRGGRLPSVELIELLRAYRDETSEKVWDIMALTFMELKKFVEQDEAAELKLREFAGWLARPQYERLGWEPHDDESEDDTKLRSTILGMMIYSQEPDILARVDTEYARGLDDIDPEQRAIVVGNVVYRSTDTQLVEELFERYRSSQSVDLRDDLCSAMTSVRQPEQVEIVLKNIADSKTIRSQDVYRWFAYMVRNRYARVATWRWMRDNWDWIEQTFGSDKSYDIFPQYSAGGLVTHEQLAEYREFFTPKRFIVALARVIDLGIREIEGRLEILDRDTAAVCEALRNADFY